ncbi:hypothetical protein V1525DRAFT_449528 [Lipomyces kononenkoae]|uniref:Uncharacterized protein n=1 Tax=Lipomyces kononenkoae TaxID=34357 RepID=A0ACC3T3S6_LIPKO
MMLTLRNHPFLKYWYNRWCSVSLLDEVLSRSPESSVTKFSSLQPVTSSNVLPHTVEHKTSDFDKALYLLQNNPPEQRLDIPLSHFQYRKLEESWSKFKSENNTKEEKRYPSLSYNSLEEIATVVTTQSALHDYIGSVFRKMIESSVSEYLSAYKPRAISRIKDLGSTTMVQWNPDGEDMSSKEPDQSFGYQRDEEKPRLQVAIECGVSENYKALCRDKDLWIHQLGAKVVVLLCLKETPQFRSPRTAFFHIKDPFAEVKNLGRHADNAINLEQGIYGPIDYRKHSWVGEVSELFVEVWRDDGKQPVRKWLIQEGQKCSHLPKTVGLKISDFFPENEWDALKVPDSSVRFRRHLFKELAGAMKLTAEWRFLVFARQSRKAKR